MNVLRIPPFPIQIKYEVPLPNTDYLFIIEDFSNFVEALETITSDENSEITFSLTGNLTAYDQDYSLYVYDLVDGERSDLVIEDTLSILRPYVNPKKLGTTATEIAESQYNERVARAVIDSIVTDGFRFERRNIEVVGQGTDYLSVWRTIYKVNKVYENGVLVFDSSETEPALDGFNYVVTKDKTAIVKVPVDSSQYESKNRNERKPLKYRDAGSDSFYAYAPYENFDNMWTNTRNPAVSFPEGFDYIIEYDSGYKVIPSDVTDATNMLIDDIKCGKMDHFKAYVDEYETDQFKIKYDKRKFSKTGNILVDIILDKYLNDLRTPGIL